MLILQLFISYTQLSSRVVLFRNILVYIYNIRAVISQNM